MRRYIAAALTFSIMVVPCYARACFFGSAFVPPQYASFAEANRAYLGSLVIVQRSDGQLKGLQANESKGVGFLIDQRSGLFLTAAHVVAATLLDDKSVAALRAKAGPTGLIDVPPVTMHGRLASSFSDKITFDRVLVHPHQDVAVLRVTSSDLSMIKQARPFELVFAPGPAYRNPPVAIARFAYLKQAIVELMHGLPTDGQDEDQRYHAVIKNRPFEPVWHNGHVIPETETRLRVGAAAVDGDSGGPVILDTAAVLGVVRDQQNRDHLLAEALYGILRDKDFLRKVESLRREDVVEVARAINQGGFANWRRSLSSEAAGEYFSNLDAAHLFGKLAGQPSLVPEFKAAIECPIFWAMHLRYGPHHSIDGVSTFASLGESDQLGRARALAQAAVESKSRGANFGTFLLAEQAAESYSTFIANRITKERQGNRAATCTIAPMAEAAGSDLNSMISEAQIKAPSFNTQLCAFSSPDNETAVALVELFEMRKVQVELSSSHGYRLGDDAIAFSKSASASPILAYWIADKDATKAKAFEQLGNLFALNGDTDGASRSYKAAYTSYLRASIPDLADKAANQFGLAQSEASKSPTDYKIEILSHPSIDEALISEIVRKPLQLRVP